MADIKYLDKTGLGTVKSILEGLFSPKGHKHVVTDITNFPSSMPASDVYDWAKSATKPSYSFNEINPGVATIGDGVNRLMFRTHESYRNGMYYSTPGNEALVFATKNSVTSWIFATTDPNTQTAWNSLTPSLQIKNQRVTINKLIPEGGNASYNLDINGSANATTLYENGTRVSITGHDHDGRYYTESEIDNKLSGKSNTDHGHSGIGDGALVHMCSLQAKETYNAYKIITNWNKASNYMPTINIRGYAYGSQKTIDCDIVMYHYNSEPCNYSITNKGSYDIKVYSAIENNVQVFYIEPGEYFGMFNVFVYGGMGTSNFTGWTMETASAVSGTELPKNAIATSVTGNAGSATKLETARTLTIGNTGKTFNGQSNISWTLSEIGAAATHDHPYLPLTGGTMSGAITFGDGAQGAIKYGTHTTSALKGLTLPGLGSAGIGIFSRAGKSTDEGGIIITEDSCLIYNSFDSGWGFSIHDKDLNQTDISSDATKVFGITQDSYYAWSRGGYKKEGSSNNYVLLGGGGHKAVSDFSTAHSHPYASDTHNHDGRYAWGDYASQTNLSDCNAVSSTGFWTHGGFENRPSEVANWGSLMNIRLYDSNNNYHRQLFFDCYGSDKIWTRSDNGGSWTDWKELSLAGHTHSEYAAASHGTHITSDAQTWAGEKTYSSRSIFTGGGAGSSSISYANAAMTIGTVNRSGTVGDYYPGIAFNHMYTYNSGASYRNHAHAWIGLKLHSTPTAELSYLIFATNNDTTNGTSPKERMSIAPDGTVNIINNLTVDGTITAGGVKGNSTSNNLEFRHLDGQNCNGDYNLYLQYHRNTAKTYFNGTTYYINGSYYNGTAENANNATNATTATDASKLGGYSDTAYFAYRGWDNTPGKDANTAMSGVMGSNFSYSNNCPYTGPLLTFNCGGYNLQLNGAYSSNSGKNLAFRLRNGDNGTNHDWYTICHSGNIGDYALTSLPSHNHDDNYLKLSGGTMTGSIIHSGLEENGKRILYGKVRNSGIKYDYQGNECLMISSGTYAQASIAFYTCNRLSLNDTNNQWVGSSPDIHIKNGCVYINKIIANGTNASYNLDVNGSANATTLYENGTRVSVSGHNHDDRYYTESEIDTKLGGKSDTGHGHDYLPLAGGAMTSGARISASGGNLVLGNSNNAGWVQVQDMCSQSGSDKWKITQAGSAEFVGSVTVSAGFFDTSDERLKDFYDDIDVDFDKLRAIPKKYFSWKNDKNKEIHLGTSAQEIQKVYPEIVNESADGELSVDYSKLSVVALAAVDKLYDKINKIEQALIDKGIL